MNYLMVIKRYVVDCMIANEYKAAEIQDSYYKLLIRVSENKITPLEFRKFYGIIQRIIDKV